VEHVEAAELVDGGADRRLQAVGVGHVGTDRDRFVSSEVGGFLAGPSIDISNGDSGALANEQDCGGAADPVTGAGDEGYPAREPWHDLSSAMQILKQPDAGGSPCDIVPLRALEFDWAGSPGCARCSHNDEMQSAGGSGAAGRRERSDPFIFRGDVLVGVVRE
jgi:hypothetical protein